MWSTKDEIRLSHGRRFLILLITRKQKDASNRYPHFVHTRFPRCLFTGRSQSAVERHRRQSAYSITPPGSPGYQVRTQSSRADIAYLSEYTNTMYKGPVTLSPRQKARFHSVGLALPKPFPRWSLSLSFPSLIERRLTYPGLEPRSNAIKLFSLALYACASCHMAVGRS